MSLQKTYPFRRISVDHMIYGTSRVWWQLEPEFNDLGPYTFQLQVGGTGLQEADDWQDIGAPVVNGYYALDDKRHDAGTVVTAHYRVTLTTSAGVYVSQNSPSDGELDERDWTLSREIIRKERLRHRKVSVSGYLIKAFRYGSPCPRCRDALTQEAADTDCPVCYGTGWENGYHPALPLQCWDLSPQIIEEGNDANLRGTTRENALITARVIGFPGLNYRDVWVNGTSDERWTLRSVKVAAAIRGVPLVYEVQLELIPLTNIAYKIPRMSAESGPPVSLPSAGTGCETVAYTHAGLDLRYLTAAGEPITDARVYAFKKADVDRAFPDHPPRHLAVAGTETTLTGWAYDLRLDPGVYVLLYEKADEFGPDTRAITVLESVRVPGSSSSSTSSASSARAIRRVDTFWDI
jgi:hypothetical protein